MIDHRLHLKNSMSLSQIIPSQAVLDNLITVNRPALIGFVSIRSLAQINLKT